MAKKYTNIFYSKGPPKFTLIGIFGFGKIPSGNPGACHALTKGVVL
jgi:hypothetical protein